MNKHTDHELVTLKLLTITEKHNTQLQKIYTIYIEKYRRPLLLIAKTCFLQCSVLPKLQSIKPWQIGFFAAESNFIVAQFLSRNYMPNFPNFGAFQSQQETGKF